MEDPGNTHDSIYFQYTYLWNKTETSLVFPDQVQVEDDFKIPPAIPGDRVFSLRTWITKPYQDAALLENFILTRGSRSRMVTEEALDQLEDTFRVFQRKCESDKKTMKTMVLASVEQLKIWIERADPIPRVIDLRYDAAANKH